MRSRGWSATATILALALAVSVCSWGCSSAPSTKGQSVKSTQSQASVSAKSRLSSYSEISTPYPDLYTYAPDSPLEVTYDEGKVISWTEAGDHIGQNVTVEGELHSVVNAASSNGSPYYFDIGADALSGNGFTIVVWEEDRPKFDQYWLEMYEGWSNSGEPITGTFRVSGTIETYEGRPEIVARSGTQVSCDVKEDGHWYTLVSESEIESIRKIYKGAIEVGSGRGNTSFSYAKHRLLSCTV